MAKRFKTLLAVMLIIGTMPAVAASPQGYDRTWWQSTEKKNRLQFLAGYIACESDDLGKKTLDVSWYTLEPEITKYYALHTDSTQTVTALTFSLAPKIVRQPPDPHAEHDTGKYGFFDGDYWNQLTPADRVGFVEGYIACWQTVPGKQPSAAHSADWYVSQIDKAYHLTPDGQMSDADVDKKIPPIIQALAH